MTLYDSNIHTICEVVFSKNPTHKFTLNTGKKISFAQYVEGKYKVKV